MHAHQLFNAAGDEHGLALRALGVQIILIVSVLALLQPRYPDLRPAGLFRHTTARDLAAHLTDLTRGDAREESADTADAVPAARTDGSGRGARRAQALGQWTPRARR